MILDTNLVDASGGENVQRLDPKMVHECGEWLIPEDDAPPRGPSFPTGSTPGVFLGNVDAFSPAASSCTTGDRPIKKRGKYMNSICEMRSRPDDRRRHASRPQHVHPSESESFRVVSDTLRIYVEVGGTAMEAQMIRASIYLASIPKPGAKDFVRMIVHGVSGRSGEERPPILELAKRLEQ